MDSFRERESRPVISAPRALRQAWLAAVEAHGHGMVTDEVLTREQWSDEFLLMGLRLAEGIDLARYEALAGRSIDPSRVAMLKDHGLVEATHSDRLRATPPGFAILDAIVADLAA